MVGHSTPDAVDADPVAPTRPPASPRSPYSDLGVALRDTAIVGMGCRFPGARDLPDYWRLLRRAERQFRPVPPERWNHALVHTPDDRRARNGTYTDQLATIAQVDHFDARHYRMSPRRVQGMDPQHRLLLDASREALQDAGWEKGEFDRERTGVFFGLNLSEYLGLVPDVRTMGPFVLPGVLLNMAAANVSQFFGLHGPSFAVDAACSASTVALHQAVASLTAGESRVALVGGAYLAVDPGTLLAFSKIGAVSADGVCRPFDTRADGFVLGDGVGVLVLRPLDDALAAGDRIYAVIRGVGMSNDGASEGPMTPRAGGQLLALERAYLDAGFSARSVGAFEAHGTATVVGDATEIEAITRIRTEGTGERVEASLGSVKSLIGHSLGASGAASVIKAALMLHHRTILPMPPTRIGREAELHGAGLRIPGGLQPWQHSADTPRRAGVSNFGFGGTNVHVVLEEAPTRAATGPAAPRSTPAKRTEAATAGTRDTEPPYLFLFSAGSVDRLVSHLERFAETVDETPDLPLAGIARTLAARRLLTARLAVVAAGRDELRARVEQARSALAQGRTGTLGEGICAADRPLPEPERAVAFLCPGQGSQYPGMLRDLFDRFPVVRETLQSWDTTATAHPGGFSLLAAVHGPDSDSPQGRARLTGTDVCQPVLGALGVAVGSLVRALGLAPAVSLGHSVGEFPAAVLAGALEPDECARLLLTRGAHMRRAESHRQGGMLAVRAAVERTEALTRDLDDVWVACYNHPGQTVCSGTPAGLAELARRCAAAGVTSSALEVSNGFHSPLLDPVREDLAADLATRRIDRPAGGFVSTVSGRPESDPSVLRELWAGHASAPVRFSDAVRSAHQGGARIFVQLLGGSSLLGAVRHSVPDPSAVRCVALTGQAPDDARSLLGGLGELAVTGVGFDATGLVPAGTPLVTLPPSPLAATAHWHARVVSRVPGPPTAPGLTAVLAGEVDSTPVVPYADAATALVVPVPAVADRAAVPDHSDGRPRPIPPRQSPDGQEPPMNDVVMLMREQLEVLRTLTGTADRSSAGGQRSSVEWSGPRPASAAGAGEATAPTSERVAEAAEEQGPTAYQLVRRQVHAEIAAVSAFSVDQLTDDTVVTHGLGFDSLMVTELLERLRRHFPVAADGIGPDLLSGEPTIAMVVDAVADLVGAPREVAASHELRTDTAPGTGTGAGTGAAAMESRIEDFPELLAMERRAAALDRNPYFLLNEGTMGATTRIDGRELISFSGYNYLGLSGHPEVTRAVKEAVDTYGSSVSASRFLSGNKPLHHELEAELAALNGCEAAIALVSGHATNVTVIGHLVGPEDLVVHDALAHDSILQGCKLSGARRRPFPHNDMAALDDLLSRVRGQYRRVLIVVEGVYSMDGDIVDLPALIEVKRRHGALVMIDEAHSIGTVGATGGGVGEHFLVDRRDVDLWSGTLSKSLAGCGGYVAGTRRVVDYLKAATPGFVYSVGMTPANTAASLAAIRVMRAEPERLKRLWTNSEAFLRLAREAGIDTGDSYGTPVVPVIVKDSAKAVALSAALSDRGISANPILHPAVAEELVRLRFFITSEHTADQLTHTVDTLAEQLRRLNG
ncbi:type I polyketide synthase [Kitasatospora cinereorecta]|uniref:Type I polyketide synthase n=1 Tax=Kitasatospora cinereorecta TaxID=285560 RepID=A0ABW0V3A6_9ACTN